MRRQIILSIIVAITVLCESPSFSGGLKKCEVRNPSNFAAKGGFSGQLNSSVKWQAAGTLKTKEGYLCPYLYTLIWGESGRETARLVLFSDNYSYLGSYGLTGPQNVFVKSNKLVIKTMMGRDESFNFDSMSLPPKIYVDGEVVSLFK